MCQDALQGVKGSPDASKRQQGILDFCGCGSSPFSITAKGKCLLSYLSLAQASQAANLHPRRVGQLAGAQQAPQLRFQHFWFWRPPLPSCWWSLWRLTPLWWCSSTTGTPTRAEVAAMTPHCAAVKLLGLFSRCSWPKRHVIVCVSGDICSNA